MDRGSWHCTGGRDQDHLQEKEIQKSKMAVWRGLTNSCEKKRSKKKKGEKERYTHLNAEFQRIARRDKKAFLGNQCKKRGPAVTREYTPRSCRNSRKPMRLSPPCEMRPDSPALYAEQLRFSNQTHKEPRFAWLNSRKSPTTLPQDEKNMTRLND